MNANEKLGVRLAEAAEMLSASERWVWQYSHPRGDIPCARIGGAVIYPVQELQQWLSRAAAKNEGGPQQ
jgi:predicted DNA-binding transcriptional regulator AlpA